MNRTQSGGALVFGLLLLSLITLLGLASVSAARVELQLAHNELFRENAASAASAGVEIAISHVTASAPESIPSRTFATLPGGAQAEIDIRFLGYETGLPQLPEAHLAAAHFEITSTGQAARGAIDRQRARVARIVATADSPGTECDPVAPGVACAEPGRLSRLSWQRVPPP